MTHANNYLVNTYCAPQSLCELNVYAPGVMDVDFDGPALIDRRTGARDQNWIAGYGPPIIAMRGFNAAPPNQNAAAEYERQARVSYIGPPQVSNPYYSHDHIMRSAASGDHRLVLGRAQSFLTEHCITGEVRINPRRLGYLGELALAPQAPDSELAVPSVAYATAIGALPDLATYIAGARH